MGVRRSDYIVVGVNIGYSMYNDELFEEVYEEYSDNNKVGEMTYLIDSYGGKYFIVGEVLQSDEHGDNGLNFDLSSLSENKMLKKKIKVYDFIVEKFGVRATPSVMVKTHWT